jgi:prevent-host-death family protein
MSRRPTPRRVRETVSLYEAKTHLSALVERAASGEEILIAKSGKPRAKLVPLTEGRDRRMSGRGKGSWRLRKDFDAPLPPEILREFGDPG